MMRYYDDSIDRQEEAADMACKEAAVAAGHDQEAAEECEDGELKCATCPFKEPTK